MLSMLSELMVFKFDFGGFYHYFLFLYYQVANCFVASFEIS